MGQPHACGTSLGCSHPSGGTQRPPCPGGCGARSPSHPAAGGHFTRWQSRLEQRDQHQSRLYWEYWFLPSAVCWLIALQGQTSSCPLFPIPSIPLPAPSEFGSIWVGFS